MKRRILIIPIILILLFSCERQYIDIDESSRPYFENNDTLVFVNQECEPDSFLIRMYYDYQYFSRDFKEKINYYYIALNNGFMDSLVFSVGIGGVHDLTWLESQYQFHTISYNPVTIMQNGDIFTNTLKYYQDTMPFRPNYSDSVFSKPVIKSVLYSDYNGIIRYEKQNGEIYKLLKNEN